MQFSSILSVLVLAFSTVTNACLTYTAVGAAWGKWKGFQGELVDDGVIVCTLDLRYIKEPADNPGFAFDCTVDGYWAGTWEHGAKVSYRNPHGEWNFTAVMEPRTTSKSVINFSARLFCEENSAESTLSDTMPATKTLGAFTTGELLNSVKFAKKDTHDN